jgi:hypothetical protein
MLMLLATAEGYENGIFNNTKPYNYDEIQSIKNKT